MEGKYALRLDIPAVCRSRPALPYLSQLGHKVCIQAAILST